MPVIVAAAHAFPPHTIPQPMAKAAVGAFFAGKIPDLEKILEIFDHSRIDQRQFVRPPLWYTQPHTPEERNRVYLEDGLELCLQAARACLEKAGCPPEAVDHIIFVSSTGYATPTLDAHIINRLGLPPGITRLPIWGLGCAAGAAGLARAADYGRAWPRSRTLLVALETCSLTFLQGDLSKKNLVAISLFADGAAAALVAGESVDGSGPRIVASSSHLFPESYRIMGWDFLETGMSLVLSPRLPAIVEESAGRLTDEFLAAHHLTRSDLRFYITHPGGARVVDAIRKSLALTNGELALTEEVLRRHGNMSSVSVLVVLEEWMARQGGASAGHGLLSAFGPGFSAELVLLRL